VFISPAETNLSGQNQSHQSSQSLEKEPTEINCDDVVIDKYMKTFL
jgi:hypothetical protein